MAIEGSLEVCSKPKIIHHYSKQLEARCPCYITIQLIYHYIVPDSTQICISCYIFSTTRGYRGMTRSKNA